MINYQNLMSLQVIRPWPTIISCLSKGGWFIGRQIYCSYLRHNHTERQASDWIHSLQCNIVMLPRCLELGGSIMQCHHRLALVTLLLPLLLTLDASLDVRCGYVLRILVYKSFEEWQTSESEFFPHLILILHFPASQGHLYIRLMAPRSLVAKEPQS